MIFKIDLPLPPSVNNLFINKRGRGGRVIAPRYRAWKAEAEFALWQRALPLPAPIDRPVSVLIEIGNKCRCDLDNMAKPLLDFLVSMAILHDDNKRIVRCILLQWADIPGARVSIFEGERGNAGDWT
jgi:Holliday junction resolvase RusA-like endonuclease